MLTASSNEGSAKNVVDCAWASGYDSAIHPTSWVCIDFKFATDKMISYPVRSLAGGELHLRGWVVEGSTDGENWITFDRRSQSDSLNGANATGTFWTFRERAALDAIGQLRFDPQRTRKESGASTSRGGI
jgi:hypothetical protein